MIEINDLQSSRKSTLREGGTYLITGGMGELGYVFAEYIAEKTHGGLILTGRKLVNEAIQERLYKLRRLNSDVTYVTSDISSREDVQSLYQQIKKKYGTINGILHTAGVNRDSFLMKKTQEEMKQVLSAKVDGTRYLDEVFAEEKLDFFVFFSSIAAVFGNVGQSDYGYANSFMDSYAAYREQLKQQGKRYGKTVSINWPLWDQGMSVDQTVKESMENGDMGLKTLCAAEGIEAFEEALQQSSSQFIIVKGNEKGIDKVFQTKDETREERPVKHVEQLQSDGAFEEKVKEFLKEIVSRHTKIAVSKIRNAETFENYGIDSITIMGLTKSLEESLGKVSKTLFFEYENIEELGKFLIRTKKKELQQLLGIEEAAVKKTSSVPRLPEKAVQNRVRNWFQKKKIENNEKSKTNFSIEYTGGRGKAIAVIGLSGRYPMADNLQEFWNNLSQGKDCITEIPEHRWNHARFYDKEKGKPGKTYSKWGGFVNNIEMFDPMFFKIPPIEAEFLDPHERIFLETVWEALEDSGYTPESLKEEKVGVFAGVMYALYQLYQTKQYGGTMNGRSSFSSIANRISYIFDFKGPSIALDTMCSSALTALSLACESIHNGTSTMAVAGGVNFSLHPSKYVQLSQGGFLSTDGRCRTFGEGGDGYVPGEGCGAVIVKELERAVLDGDHIYGIIRGIQVNAGGKTSGYTVPNLNAQRELIKETLKQSEINPETISSIEAHGTGTALGDPIEVEALTQAYSTYGVPKQYCSIGSLKSNIGHLEAASGIAALTKVLLEMKYKKLVPSLHSEKLNPFIPFSETPFFVQHKLEEWKQPVIHGKQIPRRAAISAFGAGGSNAHVIIEEYEAEETAALKERKDYLFVLSAKNETRLREYAQRLYGFIKSEKDNCSLEDIVENDDSRQKVMDVISEILGVPDEVLTMEDSLKELGMDPYTSGRVRDMLSVYYPKAEVEQKELLGCKTIQELVELVQDKTGTQGQKAEKPKQERAVSSWNLSDAAYTLQVGRQPMEQRLAVIVSDEETLAESLQNYLKGESPDTYRTGNVEQYKEKFEKLLGNKGIQKYLSNQLRERNLDEVAEFWIMGAAIDWSALYENQQPHRISLPTYPFAKERYWILKDDGSGRLLPDSVLDEAEKIQTEHTAIQKRKTADNRMETIPKYKKNLSEDNLEKMVIEYLKDVFSKVLKIPYDYLEENQDYEDYGIDSIYIGKLNQYLQKQMGELPSTLFFTYKNIRLLAGYFIKEKKEQICKIIDRTVQSEKKEQSLQKVSVSMPQKECIQEAEEHFNDIAVIGISGRFPKAEGLDEYFENLRNGKDCIETIPKERWNIEDYPEIACKWGGFIKDAEKFDPQFFNIAPIMAAFMDPQERIFLEAVWTCMEDAGYTPKAMESQDEMDTRGNVAVYAGITFNEYGLYGAGEIARGRKTALNSQIYSIANRISYLFNFGGPSLSVDTACSSSLYAVHLACNSILSGEADMALAGGVNLSLHPSKYITLDWAKFLASDGHCHTFGKDGDGYVPGEGTGAVLLKPLWKAKQDHDHIYAVIKGSAVNHGGKTYGYSVPNPAAQSSVIQKAVKRAGIHPRTISYIEAHGTGTALGDPIEIAALTDVYKKYTDKKQFCSIGSVKSNIGHLEAAAGISQLIKVILQLQHKELVPSRLNADEINPNISFEETPFYVQKENEEWKRPVIDGKEYPRRAGISAFGVGGVNVHMIVEEYETEEKLEQKNLDRPVVITCSARTESALCRYLKEILDFIQKRGQQKMPDLKDVSYTMHEGRVELAQRAAFVVKSYDELEEQITCVLEGQLPEEGIYTGKVSSIDLKKRKKNEKEVLVECRTAEQIAESWVNGNSPDFSVMYGDCQPGRVSLPTYPYEKEVYWMYSKETEGKSDETGSVEELESSKETEGIVEQIQNAYEDEQRMLVIEHVQKLFAKILCFTEGRLPDVEEGFFALGLESVATRQAIFTLEDEFLIKLDEQVFFNYPNITELSDYILSQLSFKKTQEEKKAESQTLYYKEQWFEAEQLTFTESFGRGTIALIECRDTLKEEIKEKFDQEIQEKITFFSTLQEFSAQVQKGELPDKIVFMGGLSEDKNDELEAKERIHQRIIPVFEAVKAVVGRCNKNLCLYYFFLNTHDGIADEHNAVNGLFKSVMMENSDIYAKTVSITDEKNQKKHLMEIVAKEIKAGCIENEIQYEKGKREVKKLYDVQINKTFRCKFKKNGIYLITGGLGGLGSIISKYLCSQYKAKLILCGRKEWNEEIAAQIREIQKDGGEAGYIKADISDALDVHRLVEEARKLYGKINGVIHAAAVIHDVVIKEKQADEFEKIIAPKVLGTYYLDQELATEKLDFFILFSSMSSVLGNAGQSDYCYGNRFMDCFAETRSRLVKRGSRKGKTIVINWSFWKEGGMKLDELQTRWMERQFGLVLMDNSRGLAVLEDCLKADSTQVVVFNGDQNKIRDVLGIPKPEEEQAAEEREEELPEPDKSEFDSGFEELETMLDKEGMEEINSLSEDELIELLKKETNS